MNAIDPRQHAETEISEIIGDTVECLLAVKGNTDDDVISLYILVRGIWLRVFLDAGLLFLDISDSPDAEDDLDEGASYWDLSETYGIKAEEISAANMKHGVFRLAFKSGAEFAFEQIGEETKLRFIPGK